MMKQKKPLLRLLSIRLGHVNLNIESLPKEESLFELIRSIDSGHGNTRIRGIIG